MQADVYHHVLACYSLMKIGPKSAQFKLRLLITVVLYVLLAHSPDTKRIFVDIGLGFHVEFTWSEAINYISRREEKLSRQIEEYTRLVASIKAQIKLVAGIDLQVQKGLHSWLPLSLLLAITGAKEDSAMKGGRKNLKRATEEESLTLEEGHNIMQVLSLRGSNLIEVMDAQGKISLALFPAKFQKSMWIKRGSFVVVDDSGKEKALESGSKVTCIVSKVLFYEQLRALQKSPEWPEVFKSTVLDDSNGSMDRETSQQEDESSDNDGLPPLEANRNRIRPYELCTESDSGSDSDSDS